MLFCSLSGVPIVHLKGRKHRGWCVVSDKWCRLPTGMFSDISSQSRECLQDFISAHRAVLSNDL